MKTGIIEQRHGRACPGGVRCACAWRYRVDGHEGPAGRRQQLTRGGFTTKTEAREALADVSRRIAAGEVVGASPTVESYLAGWLATKAQVRKAATMCQYQSLSERFLVPHLGSVKLCDLRATHVEKMLVAMAEEGRGLVTRRRTVAVLRSALSAAEKRRLVGWNVARQVELAPERSERPQVWTAEQAATFLAYVNEDRLQALWRLYILVGLRRGEALALRWQDLDLEVGTLRVEATLGEINGHLVWGTPKTESGRRTVALDGETVASLRTHRARQAAEKLALGRGYGDDGLVFCRGDGRPLWPGAVTKRFHLLSAEAGLPAVRLHDLRHGAASLSLSAGVPLKVVSTNLGHASIAITADLYSHVLPSTAREAAEKVAAMVHRKQDVTNL